MSGLNAYRALQQEAKSLGVKASGKAEDLKARIERAKAGKVSEADKPKVKPEKRLFMGLTYREAQKVASWYKKETDSCFGVRCSGWDNITKILDFALTADSMASLIEMSGIRK